MNIILLLIGVSVVMAVIFLFAFIWSFKNKQFDDTDGPAVRILKEDKKPT